MRLLPLLLGTACVPLAEDWPDPTPFEVLQADQATPVEVDPDSVRVVTWNLKYGWGRNDIFFDGWGDASQIPESEVTRILDAQIALLEELGTDILLTQETDKASRRSGYIDQVDYILQNSTFNHAAYVPIWRARYVAQSGLGPTEMGQVVFSKWPITTNIRHDQTVSEADPGYVRYFAPKRAIQQVSIDLGATELAVLNVHPTAYSLDGTKQRHLGQIHDLAASLREPRLLGGDFNVIPPGSVNPDRFEDNVDAGTIGVTEVTYSPEEIAALDPFFADYTPAIPLERFAQAPTALDPEYDQSYGTNTCENRPDDQRRFFSHSLTGEVFWNQKLDYLFSDLPLTGGTVVQCPGDAGVTLEPMTLSDHAPVVATLVMP